MELFKLTCDEVQTLRGDTLERLIAFNRELKVNYATVKENLRRAAEEQQRKTRDAAKGKI